MRWIARSLMALLLGAVLAACTQPGALTIAGTARRVGVDLPASNGVIHVINGA
jgi:uncharacterized surface protein with fasciclin (FAS1) repeats